MLHFNPSGNEKMKTIHMKLVMPIACAIILGGLFMGYASYQITSDAILSASESDGLRSAHNLRISIDLAISTAYLDLSALAAEATIQCLLRGEESPHAVEDRMQAMLKRQPLYNSIIALDSRGIIVASTSGSVGGDRADRDYFKASMIGKRFISQMQTSRQTGQRAVFISTPVRDEEEDAILGVVMTAVRLEEVNSRYVAPVSLLGNHGFAMIVNSEGQILGHKDMGLLGERIPEGLRLRLSSIGSSGHLEFVVDNTPSMLFAERSEHSDWFSIVVCPVSDFYATTNYLARVNIILVSIVILALTMIIWLTVRGVTKALSTTIRYAGAVSHGDLNTPLSIRREDEVGMLAQSLRDMVGNLKNMVTVAEQKSREAEAAAAEIIASLTYASTIQKNLLPKNSVFQGAFADHSVIWEPRDIVGGDIYWIKNFSDGTVLCVCDCTGHGTPGAFLTMLVVSAFESTVTERNYKDTAQIVWELEKRFVAALNVHHSELGRNEKRGRIGDIHDGCDIAILYIAKDGSVTISAGNMHVFVCNGKEVRQVKGQRIFIGEGRLMDKNTVETVSIPANPDNKFYIASDGLYDQIGGESGLPFGYKRFKQIILDMHNEKQAAISDAIWEAFESYRGGQSRRDDFQLITFKP